MEAEILPMQMFARALCGLAHASISTIVSGLASDQRTQTEHSPGHKQYWQIQLVRQGHSHDMPASSCKSSPDALICHALAAHRPRHPPQRQRDLLVRCRRSRACCGAAAPVPLHAGRATVSRRFRLAAQHVLQHCRSPQHGLQHCRSPAARMLTRATPPRPLRPPRPRQPLRPLRPPRLLAAASRPLYSVPVVKGASPCAPLPSSLSLASPGVPGWASRP